MIKSGGIRYLYLRDSFFIAVAGGLAPMFDIVVRLTRTRPLPYLIAGPLLVLTLMSLVPASLNGAQGGKTEVFPVQKAAPAAVFIETPGNEA